MVVSTMLLMFTGSIAFFMPQSGTEWTAMLLKVQGHDQKLRVYLPSLESIDGNAKCPALCVANSSEDICECSLGEGTITFAPETQGQMQRLQLPGRLPARDIDAQTIHWIVQMKVLDPSFVPGEEGIREHVSVQVPFSWKEAETCAFEEVVCSSQGRHVRRIYQVEFLRNGQIVHEQAVPELVVFEAGLPAASVTLNVPAKNGNNIKLKLSCKDVCPVWISNMSTGSAENGEADCSMLKCESAAGSHLSDYWKLAKKESSLTIRRNCAKRVDLPANVSKRCSFFKRKQ